MKYFVFALIGLVLLFGCISTNNSGLSNNSPTLVKYELTEQDFSSIGLNVQNVGKFEPVLSNNYEKIQSFTLQNSNPSAFTIGIYPEDKLKEASNPIYFQVKAPIETEFATGTFKNPKVGDKSILLIYHPKDGKNINYNLTFIKKNFVVIFMINSSEEIEDKIIALSKNIYDKIN